MRKNRTIMGENTIKSPCISVCVLDDADICEGCYRSASEITEWTFMSDEERLEVLKNAKKRFQKSNKNTLL